MQPTFEPPPPGPPQPDIGAQHHSKHQLSDGAEDLIIAFSSIGWLNPGSKEVTDVLNICLGGTLLFLFLVYAFYQTRRGVPFNELLNFKHAMRRRKIKETLPISSPPSSSPRLDSAKPWDAQSTYATATVEKVGIKKGPQKPRMVMIRTNSDESTRQGKPPDAWQEKSVMPAVAERSFLDESSVPPILPTNWPLRSHQNSRSSSPIIPPGVTPSQSDSRDTRGTRDRTITSNSGPYANPDTYGSAPHEQDSPTGPNISRFSWTNYSQEPPTPRYALERQSVATSARSSLPRFRKVDSWVNNQTGRISSVLFRNQPTVPRIPDEGTWNGRSDDAPIRAPQPRQPPAKVWKSVLKDSSDAESEDRETLVMPTQQEKQAQNLVKDQHVRQISDATVFRQHPGTMLSGPRNSVVPSEDLDRKIPPAGSF